MFSSLELLGETWQLRVISALACIKSAFVQYEVDRGEICRSFTIKKEIQRGTQCTRDVKILLAVS
jgi:hypothetical protein